MAKFSDTAIVVAGDIANGLQILLAEQEKALDKGKVNRALKFAELHSDLLTGVINAYEAAGIDFEAAAADAALTNEEDAEPQVIGVKYRFVRDEETASALVETVLEGFATRAGGHLFGGINAEGELSYEGVIVIEDEWRRNQVLRTTERTITGMGSITLEPAYDNDLEDTERVDTRPVLQLRLFKSTRFGATEGDVAITEGDVEIVLASELMREANRRAGITEENPWAVEIGEDGVAVLETRLNPGYYFPTGFGSPSIPVAGVNGAIGCVKVGDERAAASEAARNAADRHVFG